MGIETEIKFEVSPHDLHKLAASRRLRTSGGQLADHRHIVSTYYDTPDHLLNRNGVSLRVRQIGKKRIQTVKTSRNGVDLARNEWESRIDGDEPDLSATRGTPLQQLVSRRLKRNLEPVFSTHVHRTLIPLQAGNSRIELALDEGHIRAGPHSSQLAEIELELKSGPVGGLFKTARELARLIPMKLALKTKSLQGYDLITSRETSSVPAAKIVLPSKANLETCFQAIARSSLNHIAANEPAVLAGLPDGVHQMRVGVRRLRAAIWVFSEMLHGKQTDSIRNDLKWLARKLGPVRDLDVFLATRVKTLEAAESPVAGLGDLLSELEYRRAVAAEAAKAAVAGARYRLFILNALEWIEAGSWLKFRPKVRKQNVRSFAAELFGHRIAKAKKRAKAIGDLDVHDRHELRISLKKLRYAIYFFESLFSGRASKKTLSRYKKCLGELQDSLGALNDIAVHQRLIARLTNEVSARTAAPAPFSTDSVMGIERAETRKLLRAAERAARRLRSADAFW